MNKPVDVSGVCLTTERLVLRPWSENDLEDFYEYARVDGVGQMAGWAPHKSMEESKTILDSFIRSKKTFAIELNGKAIGSVGVEMYNENDFPEMDSLQGREIGYALSKDYWGSGIMPEAVKAVIEYLFTAEKLILLRQPILCGTSNRRESSKNAVFSTQRIPFFRPG